MINAFFFPIFEWFARTKWAQQALIIAVAVLTLGLYVHSRDSRIRKDEGRKAELDKLRQIESQKQETADRVEAYHDGHDRIEHLPDIELFDATEADPNRRGIVSRD